MRTAVARVRVAAAALALLVSGALAACAESQGHPIRVEGISPLGVQGAVSDVQVRDDGEAARVIFLLGSDGAAASEVAIHGLPPLAVRRLRDAGLLSAEVRLEGLRRDSPAGPSIRLSLSLNGARAVIGDNTGPGSAVAAGRRLHAGDVLRRRGPADEAEGQGATGGATVVFARGRLDWRGKSRAVDPLEPVTLEDPDGDWTFLLLAAEVPVPQESGSEEVAREVRRLSADWLVLRVE
jgi:hypothetical protein